jgi:hypothetical protein
MAPPRGVMGHSYGNKIALWALHILPGPHLGAIQTYLIRLEAFHGTKRDLKETYLGRLEAFHASKRDL